MTDMVERLRRYAKNQGGWHMIDETCEEAADEIERLREVLRYEEIHRAKEKDLAEAKVNELNVKLVKQLDQMRKDNAKLRAEIRELNAAGAEFETPALPAKGK